VDWSALRGFHNRIKIPFLAKFVKFIPQASEVGIARNIHGHLNRKHRGARMRGVITTGIQFRNFEASTRKEAGQIEHNAFLVDCDGIDIIRGRRTRRSARRCRAQVDRQAGFLLQSWQRLLDFFYAVPVTRYQHQHCKFRTQRDHPAFANVPARTGNGVADVADQPCSIGPYCSDSEKFFHNVILLITRCRREVYREMGPLQADLPTTYLASTIARPV